MKYKIINWLSQRQGVLYVWAGWLCGAMDELLFPSDLKVEIN